MTVQNKLYEYINSELLAQDLAVERLLCCIFFPFHLESEGPQNFA